jgi:hypothetical protein
MSCVLTISVIECAIVLCILYLHATNCPKFPFVTLILCIILLRNVNVCNSMNSVSLSIFLYS